MIKIDISQIDALAGKIGALGPAEMAKGLVKALNETVDSAYALGRKTMLAGINLTDDYVQRRMEVERATEKNPVASIVAPGGKGFQTPLSHYGAMLRDTEVNWTNATILERFGKFSRWPGWTERKGDPARGIEPDMKAYGVEVEVVKGKRKRIHGAVVIPGKKDSEGNPLVFRRLPGSRKKVENLQGPAVYQLFRKAIPLIEGEVGEDLERAVIAEAERGWLGALQ